MVERLGLFTLGIAAVWLGIAMGAGLPPLVGALAGAAVVATIVEVLSFRRTGRRRRIGSWLPVVLGMVAAVGLELVIGPQGPDSGLATSIAVFSLVTAMLGMAITVNVLAAIAIRVTAPRKPQ